MSAILEKQLYDAMEIVNHLSQRYRSEYGRDYRQPLHLRQQEQQYILAVPCAMCGDLMDVENDEINDAEMGLLCAICIQRKCDHCGQHQPPEDMQKDANGCSVCRGCEGVCGVFP